MDGNIWRPFTLGRGCYEQAAALKIDDAHNLTHVHDEWAVSIPIEQFQPYHRCFPQRRLSALHPINQLHEFSEALAA
jgi:hypothetical protein